MATVLRHLGAALLGVVVGLAALAAHRDRLLGLPVGLVVALGATFAVAWALRLTAHPRLTASYAAGWLVVFGTAIAGRPEGDYLVAADLAGYGLMAGGLALLVVAAFSLSAPRRRSGR